MKIKDQINDLFSYNKYYKMATDDLAKEAGKYHIGSYFDGSIIRRELIIEQLIAKDNATMFKRSLMVSLIILVIAIISLIVSIIAIFLN